MKAVIEKLDHLGNGICYINNKVCFVPKCAINDEVEIEIVHETKNYIKAKVVKALNTPDRVDSFCPYFEKCGGCQLQYLSYEKTINYKKDRVKNILEKVISIPEIEAIPNDININYRNKIELKIKNGKIGFYYNESHELIEINECAVAQKPINKFIPNIKEMNINNGDVMIRCNYNGELLVSINTSDNIILNEEKYPDKKVVGIIVNGKTLYGEDHFIDRIGNYFFDISYDAFFQINSFINEKLFNIIKDNVQGDNVLDLYSGVGTLGIVASKTAKKVYSIECIPSAVLNGLKNAKMNGCNNIEFILGNVEDKLRFISDKVDTVIVDPPRRGLDDLTISKLKEVKPKKIIYISCDTQSLANNLKDLKDNYKISKLYIADMFSYSYHVETICILDRYEIKYL